ncbi:MAG: lipopolysaccharide biosynthesis protein, partial [bacterium]
PLRKEITALFGWNFLVVTFGGITAQVPVMLLGRLRGPEEAGFFRLATGIIVAGSFLETSLGRVAFPILVSRWTLGERAQLTETLKRWTLRRGFPACATLLLTVPLLPIAIPRIFGPSFEPIVRGTQVLMAGAAVSTALFWLTSFYYASGRVSVWAKAYGLYTAVAIGVGWFFIEQWGFFGLAVLVTVAKLAFVGGLAAGLLPGSPLYRALASDGEAVSPRPVG